MQDDDLGFDEAGTYALFLHLEEELRMRVGAQGLCSFPRGVHVYAGSAMGGLRARLARHVRREKRVHWHVDRLTTAAGCRVLGAVVFTSPVLRECDIIGSLESIESIESSESTESIEAVDGIDGAEVRPPRFGASDHGCRGHLIWMGGEASTAQVAVAHLTEGTTGGRWLSGEDIWRPEDK